MHGLIALSTHHSSTSQCFAQVNKPVERTPPTPPTPPRPKSMKPNLAHNMDVPTGPPPATQRYPARKLAFAQTL